MPQVEPKAKSQNRVQVNHQDGDLWIKKKKTGRGGKHHEVTLLASDRGGLLSFAGVTTPSEIILYYRLNHSVWSLSDNKESSCWVLSSHSPVNHLKHTEDRNIYIKTLMKESPECLTN
jgi:hypothetical protein